MTDKEFEREMAASLRRSAKAKKEHDKNQKILDELRAINAEYDR